METSSSAENDPTTILDTDIAKRVLRKIDFQLIPLLFVTYNLNFMDKTILSSASVFGLKDDTNITGDQYSWVSSIFYFGYLFWEYPTSYLIQRLPVGKYVGINTLFWGAVVALTAACRNYGGLITVRFLLGVAEATISPAFVYVTSMWYTREEIPTRTGFWFAGNALGGVFASFIAYGLGHVTHPLAPWMWLFIVLGVATFLWGFVLIGFLPDSIQSARFLTEEEREVAQERVVVGGTGRTKSVWKLDQCISCITDPKTWFIFAISLLTQIPNGGTQNFGNLVLTGFGFTSLQSTLVTLPASFIAFFTVVGTGWLSGRFANITTLLICTVAIFPIIGSVIIYAGAAKGVKLFAYYLLSTGPSTIPLVLGLVGANYKGSTKKLTVSAILFIAYCAGNIAGPQLFRSSDAPHYPMAFRGIMISYALVIAFSFALRFYLVWFNRRRDGIEGVHVQNTAVRVDKTAQTVTSTATIEGEDEDDVDDLKSYGFRYRM
ncbi:hypothetical protein ASPWEDRAFT_134459 [Aspergillus wentii DTO 134E9]|uniref:Major facilitator superfamily (MFS) profile domain-containing protein n=1 Tax=Aspergillus wentii DTO 134E9 TaxID=1073089 RepID=A0A1L9RM74_ASPWE|nr:uncharacterized protein ASPWEDRAFT_134459 [Aspergillus wentii DTO 134E9]OJJ35937.1 hypothetical protein ASPWEDRAFT_134459 [Aspergillus wentii DTO 134E9]